MPIWTDMRPEDFDRDVPLTLIEAPAARLTSTGDDLFSLLGLPVVRPPVKAPARSSRGALQGAPTLF